MTIGTRPPQGPVRARENWLLIKGDADGFKQLDLTDRGLLRSFWAFVWCLPAMFVTWAWWRMMFLQAMPPDVARLHGFANRRTVVEIRDAAVTGARIVHARDQPRRAGRLRRVCRRR